MSALISAAYAVGLFVFWGFYLIAVPYALYLTWRPRTEKEKRHDEKLDAFTKRWKEDPNFDGFSDRWFGWFATCCEMGWFKA